MEIMWESPARSLTGRDVANRLPRYAYTTVATVLDRLARKGFLRRAAKGRVIEFTSISSAGGHAAEQMRDALLSATDREETLAHFAAALSREEAELLRRSLDGVVPKGAGGRRP